MGDKSTIEWTDATWNPVTGCTKVSPGCDNCYAERVSKRFGRDFSKVELYYDRLDQPLRWKRPRMIFVNSMSDMFHGDVGRHFLECCWDVMERCPQHTFQILTKRPRLAQDFLRRRRVLPNVWIGTSVEDQVAANLRIPVLAELPAAVRFLSVEPLIDQVDLQDFLHLEWMESMDDWGREMLASLGGLEPEIDWVIVGGESGPKARPIDPDWVRLLRNQCVAAGVPFFFKQWGGLKAKSGGRELDGKTWDEMPAR